MPNPDDILKAMRAAGEEFARMADTVEEKLPSIAKALSRAPRQLRPLMRSLDEIAKKAAGIKLDRLVTELAEADKGAGRFLQTIGKVDRQLRASVRAVAALASSHRDLSIEAQKSIRAVSIVAEKVNSTISNSLARRTSEFKDLNREANKAARSFQTPADGGGSRRAKARPGAHLADNMDNAERAAVTLRSTRQLRGEFAGIEAELSPIKEHFYGIEESLKGLSGLIVKSKADLSKMSPEGMLEWGKSAVDQIDQLIVASEKFPGLEPISVSQLENIKAAVASMGDMTGNAEDMRTAVAGVGKQLEEMKSQGRGLNKALLRDIQRLADETGNWYGVSKKNQADLVVWRIKHQKAAERMVERGIRPSWAYAVQLGRAVKSVPIKGLADEGRELAGVLKSALGSITGMKSFTLTGIAKGFLDTEHSIKNARQELIEMTSQAGQLSALWGAGLDADAIKVEFNKLRESMNNMLGTWGVTRKDAQATTKALIDAGFSMSSILGPTLKDGKDSMLGFAKSGEYAMTGLNELSKLSRITGRSMADIAGLAGQWREQLGVSISQVGDTYLELESHARRSGMAVGKFMDRVMASSSGFVIFGGQIEAVSKTLSDLMSGMQLPPGLAQKIAGDFMDRLRQTTWEEALVTTQFLGETGRALAAKNFENWATARTAMVGQLDTEIAELKGKFDAASGDEKAAYSKMRGDLVKRRDKLKEGVNRVSDLLAKGEVDLAFQHLARMGETVAANTKLISDAFATQTTAGNNARKALEGGASEETALALFVEEASQAAGSQLRVLQTRAKELGYENEHAMLASMKGRLSATKMLKEYAKISSLDATAIKELIDSGGTVADIAAALRATAQTPRELQKRLLELQAEGYDVADATIKKVSQAVKAWEEAEGDPDIIAKAMKDTSEATARLLKGALDIATPPVRDLTAHAADQTSLQTKIEEHLADIRNKWWPLATGLLFTIAAITAVGQARSIVGTMADMIPGGRGGRFLRRFSKAGRATSRASKAIRAARAARRAGDITKAARLAGSARVLARTARTVRAAQATKAGTSLVARATERVVASSVGKAGQNMIGKAGRLMNRFVPKGAIRGASTIAAIGIEPVLAGMNLMAERDAFAQDAKQRSKARGDTKEETEQKMAHSRSRAMTGGARGRFAGASLGGMGGAAIGMAAGAILGPVGVLIGGAIGAYFGAKGGAWIGQVIGESLESEATKFANKLEEIDELGTLDDALELEKEHEQHRKALMVERDKIIAKEMRGEKITHADRTRLQKIQQELYGEEAKAARQEIDHLKWKRETDENLRRLEAAASEAAKYRLDLIKRKSILTTKKKGGELTAAESAELRDLELRLGWDNEKITKWMKREQKDKLNQDLRSRKEELENLVKTGPYGPEQVREIEEIDALLSAGGAVDPETVSAHLGVIEKLRAASGSEAAGKIINDNSTTNVYMNSQSDKILEQKMAHFMSKRGQKLDN